MIRSIKLALRFMTNRERWAYFTFLILRGLTSAMDLVGILAIGLLATSVAISLSPPSNDSSQPSFASLALPIVQLSDLPIFVSVILMIFIVKAVASVVLTARLAKFLARIEARAVRQIVKNSFGRGLENARLQTREDVVFAVQIGSQGAFNGLLNSTGVLFAEGTLFILVIGSFAFIDLDVAVGAVFYFGAVGFLIQFFLGKLMEKTGKTITKSVVETNTEISNLAEVVRESYILGIGDYFYNRIYNARLSASGNQATQFVLSGMPRYIVETALLVAISFFILIQALSGDLASSAATIAVFLSGGLRLTASLLPLQAALLNIKQSIPPAEKALALLFLGDSEDTEKPYSQITDVNRTPVSVTLRNLNFAYDKSDSYVLKNLSFEIPRGSQVAFIGASGAGKSTIADIILGILEPSSGEVLVDGVKPEELVRQSPGIFGYVPQSPAIISGTIAENIALGCQISEVDNEKLERVVSDSHLSALIQSLPMGVNTDMGNRKDELSGGQIQRIGLARALYRNPRLLILDEATSALDAESENEINGALNDLRGKVTVLMIAHRLNTIQRSDIVFLVQDGKITAQGKFSYLLQTNKTVKRLAKLMDIE